MKYLNDDAVTEIAINRPGEVWVARQGNRFMAEEKNREITRELLEKIAQLTQSHVGQDTEEDKKPLISATLPRDLRDDIPNEERGAYRVQFVLPPAVQQGTVAMCLRKPSLLDLTLDNYEKAGAFNGVNQGTDAQKRAEEKIQEYYKKGEWRLFLREAVLAHKNIIVSAGTNTGKTTALNALLKEIPDNERVVTIEDSREVKPHQKNCLHLLYERNAKGATSVTPIDLLEAMLRLTPDRPIAGELRGGEAFAYLELINSGHSGSITTVHADSPMLMFERLGQMVQRFEGASGMSHVQIIDYAKSLIDIVVQMKRDDIDGKRYVSEIYYRDAPRKK
jgi:type IV secretion system protein VirB11